MKTDYKETASKGRNGDNYLAHVEPGETIVPTSISPWLRDAIHSEMAEQGFDPSRYTVGGENSINPETGLPEFFGFKSIFKSVKKLVSSPLGSIGLSLALPGIGTALGSSLGIGSLAGGALAGGGIGALSGSGLKGILGGAVTGAAGNGLGSYLGNSANSALGLGLSGTQASGLGSFVTGAGGSAIGGGGLKNALLAGTGSGLGSLYQSGAFNNLGGAFRESGLSGALNQFGDNVAGKGDILGNSAGSAAVGGGGISSYKTPTTADDFFGQGLQATQGLNGDQLDNLNTGANVASSSNRGLNSLASAGISTYSNNKAADQLLKYQKQGLASLTPYLNHQFTPGDLTQDPGYQFQLQQGTKAIDAAAASRGNYYSGDALRSAGQFATGLADQTYNQAFNRDYQQNQAGLQGMLAKYGVLGDLGTTKATNTINNSNALTGALANYLQPEDGFSEFLKRLRA